MSAEQTKDPVAEQIRSVLDGRWEAIRQQLRADPRFPVAEPDLRLDLEAHRARTLELVTALTDSELVRATLPVDLGGTGDVGASVTGLEMIGHGDLSVFVKAGVQFGLFGGAIANLGTERHHREYLPGMADLSLPGCFAMTETGHGSDVQSILTTATYDPETDELVVHSPSPAARKDYIGGAARDARLAAVFAQLVVGEEQHGVHCVLVPLRDESGQPIGQVLTIRLLTYPESWVVSSRGFDQLVTEAGGLANLIDVTRDTSVYPTLADIADRPVLVTDLHEQYPPIWVTCDRVDDDIDLFQVVFA